MISEFFGNPIAAATLERMLEGDRIPQTILLHGPGGVGKATLVRRFAAAVLNDAEKIEADDLSLPDNVARIAEREKWPAEKRNEDPLLFATHPDFVTFPPDGPLRQISIPQMRLLKERVQFAPLRGRRRVFLIDQIDRANEQAANSLLKTLEEPPAHMVLIATAENAYDLLPTIRSRAVMIALQPLDEAEMGRFAESRQLSDAARRLALCAGSPGRAATLDLTAYDKRRESMLALLQAAAGLGSLGSWLRLSEGGSRNEKLESSLETLLVLLEDVLYLQHGQEKIRNVDVLPQLQALAARVPFHWVDRAVRETQQLFGLLRRNIQKTIALDALVMELRSALA